MRWRRFPRTHSESFLGKTKKISTKTFAFCGNPSGANLYRFDSIKGFSKVVDLLIQI